jgi:arginyl-tRNA synthetase
MALKQIVEDMHADLEAFGIRFDNWFYESSLYQADAVQESIAALGEAGWTYQQEGALWLRTTAFGDEKDRVLIRSNGEPTYMASDAAYHQKKWERGFERLIDVWGPDHHGHVDRMRAAAQALGHNADSLDIMLLGIVRLMRDGEMVRASKRAGDIVCLSELIDEVGRDAARFYFLIRSAQSPLDFDLELAKTQSMDNPVYYVQYAHARICSIIREAEKAGVEMADAHDTDLACLTDPTEIALMRRIAELPAEVAQAAQHRQPHRMTRVAQELAETFHTFYHQCRVLGEAQDITAARLVLVRAAWVALRNILTILGVSAPERM